MIGTSPVFTAAFISDFASFLAAFAASFFETLTSPFSSTCLGASCLPDFLFSAP
jgi:hypothetical protein